MAEIAKQINILVQRRNLAEITEEERLAIQKQVDELTQRLMGVHSKAVYDAKLAQRASTNSISFPLYVEEQTKTFNNEGKKPAIFRCKRFLPIGNDIVTKGSIVKGANGRHITFEYPEGALSGNKKVPTRTTSIFADGSFNVSIWNNVVISKPGWYVFHKLDASETYLADKNKWYQNIRASSCEPWKQAPEHQHFFDIIRRFHSGDHSNIVPFPLELLPSQDAVMDEMLRTGDHVVGDKISLSKRKTVCCAMVDNIIDRHLPNSKYEIYKVWGRRAPVILLVESKESDHAGKKSYTHCSDVAWNPIMKADVKVDTLATSSIDAGASVVAASSSSSTNAVVKDYPWNERFVPRAQMTILCYDEEQGAKSAIIDASFIGAGFLNALGITNPITALALVPSIIHKLRIGFVPMIETHDMVFNDTNTQALQNPDLYSQVIPVKAFNDVYMEFLPFVRENALPVTADYAFEIANKHIRDHVDVEVQDDLIQLDLLANATTVLERRVHAYCAQTNTLSYSHKGKIFNLMENSFPFNKQEADEKFHFYSFSNAKLDHEALAEFFQHSKCYHETANAESAAFLQSFKQTISDQLDTLRIRGRKGTFVSAGGLFCTVIFAVAKELDHVDYHTYKNPFYASNVDFHGTSPASSSSEETPIDSVVPTITISESSSSLLVPAPTPVPAPRVVADDENEEELEEEEEEIIQPKISRGKRAPSSPKKTIEKKARR